MAGVALDRETTAVPRNDNGDAVFSFGVAAADTGTPVLISYTMVFAHYCSQIAG